MKSILLKLNLPIVVLSLCSATLSCNVWPKSAQKIVSKIVDNKYEYRVAENSEPLNIFVKKNEALIFSQSNIDLSEKSNKKVRLFANIEEKKGIFINLYSFLSHLKKVNWTISPAFALGFTKPKKIYYIGQISAINGEKTILFLHLKLDMTPDDQFITLYLWGHIQKTMDSDNGDYIIPKGSFIRLKRYIQK